MPSLVTSTEALAWIRALGRQPPHREKSKGFQELSGLYEKEHKQVQHLLQPRHGSSTSAGDDLAWLAGAVYKSPSALFEGLGYVKAQGMYSKLCCGADHPEVTLRQARLHYSRRQAQGTGLQGVVAILASATAQTMKPGDFFDLEAMSDNDCDQAGPPEPAAASTAPAEHPGLAPTPTLLARPASVPQSRGSARKRKAAAQLDNARAAPTPHTAWDEPSAGGHAELQQQPHAPQAESPQAKKPAPKSHVSKKAPPRTTATPAPTAQPKQKQKAGSKVAASEQMDHPAQTLQMCSARVKAVSRASPAKAALVHSKQACKRQLNSSLGDDGAPGSKAQKTRAALSPGHPRGADTGSAGRKAQVAALAADAGLCSADRAPTAPFPPTPKRQPTTRKQQQAKLSPKSAHARPGKMSSSACALPDCVQPGQCSGPARARPDAVAEVEAARTNSSASDADQNMPHSRSHQGLGSSSQQEHQQRRQQGSGHSPSTSQLALVVHQDPYADWPPWARKVAEGIDEGLADHDTLVAENKALKMELSSVVQRSADLEEQLPSHEDALQRVLPFQQRLDQLMCEVAAERHEKEQLKHDLLRLQTRLDQIRAAAAVDDC